jgi:hypothetical protein
MTLLGLFLFWRVLAGIQNVEFFAGLEANGFTGRDADFSAGARIAANACLPRPDAEHAKAPKFDAVARGESLLESFKDGVDSRLSLGARQACPFNHVMDNILLDQF